MEKEEQKRVQRQRVALVLLFFILASIALLLLHYWDEQQGFFPSRGEDDWSLENRIEYNGKHYTYNKDIETVLVVGLDKYTADENDGAYTNDRQSDFLLLFLLDNSKKTWSAIQINRDTMTPVNVLGVAGQRIDTKTMQIAFAHTYGSGDLVSLRNTGDAVSDLLFDIQVDHSVSVTLDVVQQLNDAVGGVEVEVIGDFSDIDESLVEGQKVRLMGQQAMTYIRARQGMDEPTNIARMQRQRQYMRALYNQLKPIVESDPEFAAKMLVDSSEHIVSNASVTILQQLFDKVTAYQFQDIYIPEGESKVGEKFMEFYPDKEKLKGLMVELVYLLDE